MARPTTRPTGTEVTFSKDEIIVSKTDLKGDITYANEVFLKVSGYLEEEVLGQPHNLIRHHEMPACVFKLLWDTISAGKEIFAYVINQAKNGDHYWVFAHVTPSHDLLGNFTGYHSSRRVPCPIALEKVKGLYKVLLDEEAKHDSLKQGMAAATQILVGALEDAGMAYEEFVFTLSPTTQETLSAAGV